MPHPLPALAAVIAAPLLGLAVHAASVHAISRPPVARAANLPNNLCASCHGGGRVASLGGDALGVRDLMATRAYLQDAPRG
jgi:hypothetical protein